MTNWGQPENSPPPNYGGPPTFAGVPEQPPQAGAWWEQQPPPPKSNSGRVIALVVVGLLVVAGAGVGAFLWMNRSSASTSYEITALPDGVAGMTKDAKSSAKITSKAVEKDKADLEKDLGAMSFFGEAIYSTGTGAKSGVLVMAGTLNVEKTAESVVDALRKDVKSTVTATDMDAGAHGGKALCLTQSKSTICAWATTTTFGAVVPISSGKMTQDEVAELMRKVRLELEHTK